MTEKFSKLTIILLRLSAGIVDHTLIIITNNEKHRQRKYAFRNCELYTYVVKIPAKLKPLNHFPRNEYAYTTYYMKNSA